MIRRLIILVAALSFCNLPSQAGSPPKAIFTDPPHDAAHPARMEVIHVPTGGVEVNGIVYVPGGSGPFPVLVLFHGLPGNEKNLDLAQAVRRAGWAVATINYRGSWGSPGSYRFAQNLQDADALLRFLRDPAQAKTLSIDPKRMALAGHSMGAWVTALTAAHEPSILGAAMISGADLGALGSLGRQDRDRLVKTLDENGVEALADTSAPGMADELIAHAEEWSFAAAAPKLVERRMLILYCEDFFKGFSEQLIASLKTSGGTKVKSAYVLTDHGWSDRRIELESLIIGWLNSL